MTLRARLISLALRLQFPPFVWMFQFYYQLAITLSRIRVGRIPGVRSIYLSGSWVRREVIYGLSDIDFKIFVDGEKNQETYQTIRRRFSSLRRLFPMLGPPDEKGIYFLASFASDYRHYPLIQHLFDTRYFRHRLLLGDDIWSRLPLKPFSELDQSECTFARLRDWLERIHVLADCDNLCRQQKQHLFFKAVSDVALMTLRFDDPGSQFAQRAEILQKFSALVDERHGRLLQNLAAENRNCYRIQVNSLDENLRLFKNMVAFCVERAGAGNGTRSTGIEVGSPPESACADGQAVASALRALSGAIRDVRVFHWPQLPLTPFDFRLYHAATYLVECARPLGIEEFHSVKEFYRKRLRNQAVVLLRESPNFLASVDSELVDQWGSFAGSSDLVHLFFGSSGQEPPTHTLMKRVDNRVLAFQEQLAAALSHPEFGRMDLSVFARFLMNALRVLIFGFEMRQGRWQPCFTPEQVVDYLSRRTPLNASFPGKLAEQWEKGANGQGDFDERLLPKCRVLLTRMLELSQHGSSWNPLGELNELPDEQRLIISAAVITANRPMQLERCLRSLSEQVRLPEELIVVNNGMEAPVRQLVHSMQCSFPVRLHQIAQPGVARARNEAVKAARGEIIAFLDDDATVAPDWLERIERVFLRDPEAGLASGAVLNMPCGRKDLVWKFMESVEKI